VYSTLIVARMQPRDSSTVAALFEEFDKGDLPDRMGTRRRQLFHFHGLYFHLQDFDDEHGPEAIEAVRTHPSFVQISTDLSRFIAPYDPETWRAPKDAMATPFYYWPAADGAATGGGTCRRELRS
jgi:cyclase